MDTEAHLKASAAAYNAAHQQGKIRVLRKVATEQHAVVVAVLREIGTEHALHDDALQLLIDIRMAVPTTRFV
ncbi:MAG: hypothetical protein P4L87_20645 [Formivibrio sp.]|nr:hypothetical protein [Formivibrio sp.]